MLNKHVISTFLIVLLFGSAILTTLFSTRPINLPTQSANNPDAIMENVTALFMNKQGKPKLKIMTPKMVHFPTSDKTELTTPTLTLYRQAMTPWYISSKFAQAEHGIDNVDFWDEVTLQHAADENNPATLIRTQALTVHPESKTAETKEHIMLEQPNLTIKAEGMQADMEAGNVKLLSHTQGEYIANPVS